MDMYSLDVERKSKLKLQWTNIHNNNKVKQNQK